MTFRLIITASLLPLLISACELFVIGSSSGRKPVDRSQKSAEGVVHLWKAELDTGNLQAMTELMLHSSGRSLLAIERYELGDDLEHWRNLIGDKPITSTVSDTLSESSQTVTITVDYIRDVRFWTLNKQGLWYIVNVK
ncbi:MAG: hypothetical protein HYX66_00270 [Ignavibacteria bacterium]|nr:hypothetical protein [Ignavibacteria bacterium]